VISEEKCMWRRIWRWGGVERAHKQIVVVGMEIEV